MIYNNYIDTYVYGSLTGATMFLNQRGLGDVESNNSSTFQTDTMIIIPQYEVIYKYLVYFRVHLF